MELEEIKGVGAVRRRLLHQLGMESVGEVLNRLPADYLSVRNSEKGDGQTSGEDQALASVSEGAAEFRDGEFAALVGTFDKPERAFSRGGARYATATLTTEGGKIHAVWFHADYVFRSVKAGTPYLVTGKIKVDRNRVTVLQPVCDSDLSERILPVYPLSGKLSQKVFRNIVRSALKKFPAKSLIPAPLIREFALPDLQESYCDLHLPCRLEGLLGTEGAGGESGPAFAERIASARQRIELERFYSLLLSFRIARSGQSARRTRRYSASAQELSAFARTLPFELTASQKGAVNEIFADLAGEFSMNRLLQGDVGSGKTAVAACAMFLALKSGFQSALIAPTEVLAGQHFESLEALFAPLGARVVLLTSSVTGKARKTMLSRIEEGEADLIVGTHSILQAAVKYRNLSLVVIDEQHKFGVSERAKLVEKGENCDVLVMSATPIPRTLSLLFYNDLDVSVLREKPANRGRVISRIVRGHKRAEMFGYAAERARRGEKFYIVCPSVEEDEESGAEAVKGLFSELKREQPGLKTACLYGSLKAGEKQAVLRAFREGKISALITTTVIEVGVNVPDANLMIVMNADRFGLAQLHQLRGRIGRGSADGECYFYTQSENERSLERLEFLKGTDDGFAISEKDFELRGAGDYFGVSQSGFGKTLVRMDLGLYASAKALAERTEIDEALLEKYRRICGERNLAFPTVVLN